MNDEIKRKIIRSHARDGFVIGSTGLYRCGTALDFHQIPPNDGMAEECNTPGNKATSNPVGGDFKHWPRPIKTEAG